MRRDTARRTCEEGIVHHVYSRLRQKLICQLNRAKQTKLARFPPDPGSVHAPEIPAHSATRTKYTIYLLR